jgi:hypothetical protein
MRKPILVIVCLVFAALSIAAADAQTLPPKKKQDINSDAWWGKCLDEYREMGRKGTPAEICRRIKGRIEAKRKK